MNVYRFWKMKNNVKREEGATCMYCMRVVGKDIDAVAAVYKWDKEDEISGWFCRDHYTQVKVFESKQCSRFISYYADQHRRKSLSEEQRKL
jgi:heme-degrading monooxygenase HmoA